MSRVPGSGQVGEGETGERSLAVGLLLATFATLLLELLDARLLSVLTWYYLSFLAISLALLGGAAGAVAIHIVGQGLTHERARVTAARGAILLAVLVPTAHFLLLRLRIPPIEETTGVALAPLIVATLLLTLPFFVSGAVVTLALTRCGGRIGFLYGSDLVGASLGSLAVVPALHFADVFTAILATAALAALAALALAPATDRISRIVAGVVAALLLSAAGMHLAKGSPVRVAYPRGHATQAHDVEEERWNAYSHVRVQPMREGRPLYWGRGAAASASRIRSALVLIDGSAGTPITAWDGRVESLDWVQHDVTALPHHLRSGKTAIIGAGGGRDVLSALWGGSQHVTAIEVNGILVDLLRDRYRKATRIADHGGVLLVHDEARSYLSRAEPHFDVIQMSLVDTWAATGAGAFTLSENGLYTVEAWTTFLSRLAPGGLFSTSRWFSPENVSETSRLLSLCVASLLELGVSNPRDHIALVSRTRVATLLASRDPLSAEDLEKIDTLADREGFAVLISPKRPIADARLAAIAGSRTSAELALATEDPDFEYGPPVDARPYFFNMLKPGRFLAVDGLPLGDVAFGNGGVIWGNIQATATLVNLLLIALGLALTILFVPLAFGGLGGLDRRAFCAGLAFFAIIGYGFMSIQVPLLQRFSVFLGHPIYTYAIILFSMILSAGAGSFVSERIELGGRWPITLPVSLAVGSFALPFLIETVTSLGVSLPIAARCALVVSCIAPLSFLLGFCFPLGLRAVSAHSTSATPWMWGANGVSGVLASIVAVMVSMWAGIHVNLWIAAGLYLLLALPASMLAGRSAMPRNPLR